MNEKMAYLSQSSTASPPFSRWYNDQKQPRNIDSLTLGSAKSRRQGTAGTGVPSSVCITLFCYTAVTIGM